MASLGKEYCDFLYCELHDMKKRLDSAIGKSRDYSMDESGIESVSSHLQDIENFIVAKLDILGRSCPDWQRFEEQRTSEGRYQSVHPEGVPYGQTPM